MKIRRIGAPGRVVLAAGLLMLASAAAIGVAVVPGPEFPRPGRDASHPESLMVARDPWTNEPARETKDPRILEITGTALADEKLHLVREHRAAAPPPTDSHKAPGTRVFQIGGPQSEHFVVTPSFVSLARAEEEFLPDGSKRFEYGAVLDGRAAKLARDVSATNGRAVTSVGYWQMDTVGCLDAVFAHSVQMDACFQQYELMNDGVPSMDYWAAHAYGNLQTQSGKKATSAWVTLTKSAYSSAFTMYDRKPTSSSTGNCTSITLSVGVGGSFPASVSQSYDRCETWTPLYQGTASDPLLRNTWSGDARDGASRQTAVAMTVTTAESAYPVWYMTWGFVGCTINILWPDSCSTAYGPGY